MSIEEKGSKFLARWEAQHPSEPTKRKRISRSFDTYQEARLFLCNVAPKEHQWDLYRPLKQAMTAWITYRRDSGVINEKTAERQFGIADNFGLTLPKKTVSQVTTEDIQSALSTMAAGLHRPRPDGAPGRPLKLRTRRQHLTVLAQFYTTKVSGGHLRINPVAAIDRPRMPIEDPKEPTQRQVSDFLDLLDGRKAANGNLTTLVTLLEITGIRRGEGLALERGDFDPVKRVVRITKSLLQTKKNGLKLKKPKSEKGTCDVEVPDWFFALLEIHFARLDAQRDLLGDAYTDRGLVFPDAFGGYLKPDTISGQIAEIKRRAGWPEDVAGLHGLRHKFASHLAHSGQISVKDIAHVLGHADEAFTLRVYVRRKPEAPQTAQLFPKRDARPEGPNRKPSD